MSKNPSIKEKVLFRITFCFGVERYKTQYQRIVANLYLGSLPLTEPTKNGHHNHYQKDIAKSIDNLKLVVAAVTWELDGYRDIKPATEESWRSPNKGIEVHKLNVADFTGKIVISDLQDTLEKINATIKGDNGVYLHCKAGQGRSWIVAVCYLLRYGLGEGSIKSTPIIDVVAHIKKYRSQVSPNPRQRSFVMIYYVMLQIQNGNSSVEIDDNLYAYLNQLNKLLKKSRDYKNMEVIDRWKVLFTSYQSANHQNISVDLNSKEQEVVSCYQLYLVSKDVNQLRNSGDVCAIRFRCM